ncbi:MAG TPA: hypothetical protein DC006_01610 [Prevotellaceae bacterium]|nr:hypothetical protein [Prevotellaceae bacterium]HBE55117.1 hypothetical protein [Prevotellaceae bacterium]
MKKITSLVIAIFAMATSASAQYNVSGHRFFDNWSIGVDGGVTTNLRDFDTPNGGVAAIQLTKGITPVLSVQAEVQAGFNNWSNWNVNHSDCTVDNVTAALMAKVNLMNWFCGYKGAPRVFEISPKIGGGYMHYFYPEDTRWNSKNYRNAAVGKAGIDFDFNLGEKKAWTLSVKPAVVFDLTHANETTGEKAGRYTEASGMWGCDDSNHSSHFTHAATFQITAGVTYHFKTSNKSHHFTTVEPVVVEKTVEKIVEKPVEKIKEVRVEVSKEVGNTYVVEFAQNKSILTGTAKATLNDVPANATVSLDAYASPEGTKAYNKKLSQKRADAVKKYLEGRGIKVVSTTAHGAESESSNRVVYVRVK